MAATPVLRHEWTRSSGGLKVEALDGPIGRCEPRSAQLIVGAP